VHLLHLKNQEIAELKMRIQQEQQIVAHVQISQVTDREEQHLVERDSSVVRVHRYSDTGVTGKLLLPEAPNKQR